jgi:hypothetical protein
MLRTEEAALDYAASLRALAAAERPAERWLVVPTRVA